MGKIKYFGTQGRFPSPTLLRRRRSSAVHLQGEREYWAGLDSGGRDGVTGCDESHFAVVAVRSVS